ncbi:hypothetical protein [Massilia timonae]|nr:hypothetical protein [Massilia timonae]
MPLLVATTAASVALPAATQAEVKLTLTWPVYLAPLASRSTSILLES